jgi:hypothetical protein
MDQSAMAKVQQQLEANRIMRLIDRIAEASKDPACCKRMAAKIREAIERGDHRGQS